MGQGVRHQRPARPPVVRPPPPVDGLVDPPAHHVSRCEKVVHLHESGISLEEAIDSASAVAHAGRSFEGQQGRDPPGREYVEPLPKSLFARRAIGAVERYPKIGAQRVLVGVRAQTIQVRLAVSKRHSAPVEVGFVSHLPSGATER